jgi:hypothetical protein
MATTKDNKGDQWMARGNEGALCSIVTPSYPLSSLNWRDL